MTDGADSAEKVSAFWGDERADLRRHNWLEHPVARACLNMRISGDPAIGTADHWKRRFFATPAPLALSIGCGFGGFERTAISLGLVERFEACDISEKAVEQAQAYANEAGLGDRIRYSVMDLDVTDLPEARYDAIFGISSIHHVSALERLFAQCRRALKPGGLLLMDEYIGPSRFQSKPMAVTLINRLLHLLPESYRRSVYMDGTARAQYENPPIAWFEENDPSEAIRSEDIVAVLKQTFEVVDFRPYGGAVLHMLLSGTAGNYDPGRDSDVALLRVLALMEEVLEGAGVLDSDFAAIAARPR